jgi:hypothetical protein
MENFDRFIEAIKLQMQPEGRVQHVAGTLQQLVAVSPDDVTLGDLAAGWLVIARPHGQDETASVAHRRSVCAELSSIAAKFAGGTGNMAGAVKNWQAWQDAFQTSADPHQAAMAKTFARELAELQSALESSTFTPL